jgi:ABC-type sugar transport system ATPase subunit
MLLEMYRIHKSFSGVEVLTDVSFDPEPGQIEASISILWDHAFLSMIN